MNIRHRKIWLQLVTLMAVGVASGVPSQKPNVVIIYGDDVGFSDIGANGAEVIPTPNIDAFAAEGLNFTDGHSGASTCSPSRFSMMTGKYAFRHGVHIMAPDARLSIPTDIMTLPKLFQQQGYHTGIVGKWHLGLGEKGKPIDWNGEIKPGPLEVGFDSSFLLPATNDRVPCVYVEGHRVINLDPNDPLYVSNSDISDVQHPGSTQYEDARANNPKAFFRSVINGMGRIGYMSGGKSALWDDYTMADLFVEKAKDYIAANKDEPFFLFFSSQDIHLPHAPGPRFQGATKLGKRGDAMVQFDWSVGEILKTLETHGLTDNTIVIFTSDNGPTFHDDSYEKKELPKWRKGIRHDGSGPWRGGKYQIYEGGTRVPLIVRWPNHVTPGTSDATVSQIDFLASFANLLGVNLDGSVMDSRDMLDTFLGRDTKSLPFLIEESQNAAIRLGDWKYIQGMDPKWSRYGSPEDDTLFNLKDDVGEQNNVIQQYPEKAAELRALLQEVKDSPGIGGM